MKSVILDKVKISDFDFIYKILIQGDYFSLLDNSIYCSDVIDVYIKSWLVNPNDNIESFVLRVNLLPVGFLQVKNISDTEKHINHLVIDSLYHGLGYGEILLRKAIELSKGRSITLKVNKKNLKAIAFYEKFGFDKLSQNEIFKISLLKKSERKNFASSLVDEDFYKKFGFGYLERRGCLYGVVNDSFLIIDNNSTLSFATLYDLQLTFGFDLFITPLPYNIYKNKEIVEIISKVEIIEMGILDV